MISARRVAYDPQTKRLFHVHARRQVLALAASLGFTPCDFDVHSNGGLAVGGKMTLRADRLYVQVWLPSNGAAMRPTKAHFEVIGRGVAISRLATGVVARCVWNPYTEPVRRIPFR